MSPCMPENDPAAEVAGFKCHACERWFAEDDEYARCRHCSFNLGDHEPLCSAECVRANEAWHRKEDTLVTYSLARTEMLERMRAEKED